MNGFAEYSLQTFTNEMGGLTPIEFKDLVPFEPKRAYFVYNNKSKRGGHAHLNEKEFFLMSSGSCKVRVHDKSDWQEVELKAHINAIFIDQMVWHEFLDFSDGAVLVALSSTNYDATRSDYIENFDQYLKNVQ